VAGIEELIQALQQDDRQRASDVLCRMDLRARDHKGMTPVERALLSHHPMAVRLLLERRALLHPSLELPAAIVCGNRERVGALAQGIDLDRKDRFGRTPLMYAVGAG